MEAPAGAGSPCGGKAAGGGRRDSGEASTCSQALWTEQKIHKFGLIWWSRYEAGK